MEDIKWGLPPPHNISRPPMLYFSADPSYRITSYPENMISILPSL